MNELSFNARFKADTKQEKFFLLVLLSVVTGILTVITVMYYFGWIGFHDNQMIGALLMIIVISYLLFNLYECLNTRYKIRDGRLTVSKDEFLQKLYKLDNYNHIKIIERNGPFFIIRNNPDFSAKKEVYLFLTDANEVMYNSRPYQPTGFRDGIFVSSLPKELRDLITECL